MSGLRGTCFVLGSFMAGFMLSVPAIAQNWKPERNVEIVVNSGAGGASDRQARFVQRALQALPGIPSMTVTNRTGDGSGAQHHDLPPSQAPNDIHVLHQRHGPITADRPVERLLQQKPLVAIR